VKALKELVHRHAPQAPLAGEVPTDVADRVPVGGVREEIPKKLPDSHLAEDGTLHGLELDEHLVHNEVRVRTTQVGTALKSRVGDNFPRPQERRLALAQEPRELSDVVNETFVDDLVVVTKPSVGAREDQRMVLRCSAGAR
jgi:hypothetical protein